MIKQMQQTIEELKAKIKFNIDLINQNQTEVKSLIRQLNSGELSRQYEAYNTQNKVLIAQNNDLINVQLTLINFIEKYRNTAILKNDIPLIDIYSITDQQEIFDLTAKGILPFDNKHPLYSNTEFIDKLIVYYEGKEQYEYCIELQLLKERILG